MSFETDITNIRKIMEDKPLFKGASDANLGARKKFQLPLWISIRTVRARTHKEAIDAVINEEFDEDIGICDAVVPASQIVIDGQVYEAGKKPFFKAAGDAEVSARVQPKKPVTQEMAVEAIKRVLDYAYENEEHDWVEQYEGEYGRTHEDVPLPQRGDDYHIFYWLNVLKDYIGWEP